MYRMAMMGMLTLGRTDVNSERCIKMAIAHDLAEAVVGDITPHDGISVNEKHRREEAAMRDIQAALGDHPAGNEVYSLWKEYEQGQSAEAKLLKQFDKLEMLLQADEYEQAQGLKLGEFFTTTPASLFTDADVASMHALLMQQRAQRQRATQDS
eukprot:TRINITY_DN489_c0_g1_i7.p2 TRINITY_DN489_c0_g1~~TRINITY_DN489_c0_g1_i7.p2  ORF type:complete len:154 (+),score=43.14 TRINITY_DN489_c0_g1_i7:223-684(+)